MFHGLPFTRHKCNIVYIISLNYFDTFMPHVNIMHNIVKDDMENFKNMVFHGLGSFI